MIATASSMSTDPRTGPPSCGGVLVTLDGRPLPLSAAVLHADACAGLARVVLAQTFTNPHEEPLHVVYRMPLPADGAVSGYRFRLGEREIVGEIDRKDRARERFEQAIVEGHTAALLDEERSSVFTQEIGNVPPGATLVVELVIDQPLVWVAERGGGWEWRFPTVVAPRYQGAPGRVADGDRVLVETTTDPLPIQLSLELRVRDAAVEAQLESPSHTLAIVREAGTTVVGLARGAALDRDLVVRWSVARPEVGAAIDVARPAEGHARATEAFGLVTLVPPSRGTSLPKVPRDLVVLLDTSGSMGGMPLQQAQRLVHALVDRLDEHDTLEMIEFSSQPRRWTTQAVPADAGRRAQAHAWISALRASGGTEMRSGILAAIASLRAEAQRQVVLITDGLIGFEAEVVGEIHRALPQGSRVHTIGVGSAVNRSLTLPAARAGRGSETIIGIDEDPERAIARVLAHTDAPTLVDLGIGGDALVEHAPQHLPDLMAGAPARIAVRVRPEGGTLRIEGRTAVGLWSRTIAVPPVAAGTGSAAIVALFGRECVEDLEMIRAAGESSPSIEQRITSIGLEFGISTRLTSWVAIDSERSVDPRRPTRRESVPQALPHGTSVAGLGLRAAAPLPPMQTMSIAMPMGAAPMAAPAPESAKRRASIVDGVARAVSGLLRGRAAPPPAPGAFEEAPTGRPPQYTPDAESSDEDSFEDEKLTSSRIMPLEIVEVHGRAQPLADGTLVVELEVPAPGLEWIVPAVLVLELADGTRHDVAVDPARTTGSGTHPAGVRIRIVCPDAARHGTPALVRISLGGLVRLIIHV